MKRDCSAGNQSAVRFVEEWNIELWGDGMDDCNECILKCTMNNTILWLKKKKKSVFSLYLSLWGPQKCFSVDYLYYAQQALEVLAINGCHESKSTNFHAL